MTVKVSILNHKGDNKLRWFPIGFLNCRSPQTALMDGLASPWRSQNGGNDKNPIPGNNRSTRLHRLLHPALSVPLAHPDVVLLRMATRTRAKQYKSRDGTRCGRAIKPKKPRRLTRPPIGCHPNSRFWEKRRILKEN
jgi:hypothetical protein